MKSQDLLQDNIIELLGLQTLPDERKQALVDKMTELVQKRLILRLMEQLADEDAKKMAELEQTPVEMMNFLSEKFPNLEDIVNEEIIKVKQEMFEATEQV
ncbi:hypothetical protein HN858_04310 [Candidatus Falkowbacteria bacterium]|jgi:RAB protein geranylgeranyltransferase component A|nr:hypothetical protein [Candidatus Falkowbacteria bacterium]MBT5502842.1 hypothetical protein [Candidatus Falkowbacteria bacterium]MBT6573561.1 hypothetical protein [Candidatus Falkowbacteria bacterium]MBT7348869.1 hypothetical protein [Candidatus Falkowbacteria bacterium]MBT7501020.1 hypothetical protein [Candidatus Falkowbacteria bacterium]